MMRVFGVLCVVLLGCWGAAEVRAHTHHLHSTKEREADGSRTPRDHVHFEGGEHHSEFDHEAILGSTKEAEEYDQLPPTEAKRRLEVLLLKMDRNNDKNIDRKELHSWILRSFRMLSEEESAERMDEVDEDEDGYVTWAEYILETYGINNPDDQKLLEKEDQAEEQRLLREDRQLFNAADKNIDGRLDEEEFLAFSHPEEHPDMLPVILEQTLEEKDTNKDGNIDFQEYIGDKEFMEEYESAPERREVVKKHHMRFSVLDVDGSGVLEGQEVAGVAYVDKDIAEDEVDHLFGAADDDGNDILSFLEVLEHHDVFVGSEATDYGDHLHNLDRFEDEL
ncbi:reticulocalbin-2-like isoform X1 [Eriocheir sinensis]|uniref:reticulocalbin-2-like isoform X1 n=1 Tax=Eriocheir sinensis TaxID=95602 RepID=UPI0021C5EAA2|nr:reticulocalbin-2-like isoform X1 [Eriocheir sinensis]XP_050698676.1 reticulocalbin-2-like isoform X1 [Eriocheir sinensis]XP_050698677.1 reticulocalbin-2-like isoform X1 [Eriocheir sinensis]XP_050698678.1 reticulocalbin-2-like isoform X1 [Eriocheir sinensis]XP_050698679.1 reticulocalbin-2-like isoform X1 [Eriocheir sinensis]XP_050698680.1 reticulocalbin-2-like isoform X1 [Eriocheir sinensis]XP_050698681.1 reticulocalbin-2-like isoform X1 [Eriocheir sinensis]XP_050698682.1 reticulocalbin-2-